MDLKAAKGIKKGKHRLFSRMLLNENEQSLNEIYVSLVFLIQSIDLSRAIDFATPSEIALKLEGERPVCHSSELVAKNRQI